MADSKPVLNNKDLYLQKKIIIIGAGISGLACADRLRLLGFKNVQILEARDRIGGRIHGIKLDSNILELGAQWIHGEQNNVVYNMAQSFKLINKKALNYMDVITSFVTFTQFEREYLFKMFEFLEEKLNYHSEEYPICTSVLSYLDDQFNSFMLNYQSDAFNFLREGFQWYCKFMLELCGCQNLSLLSLKMYHNYKACAGEAHVELKEGFPSFLDILVSLLSPDWILTNKLVTKIDYSDFKEVKKDCSFSNTREIKVYCEDGQTFVADHVIVTIPLGCLKRHSRTLFNPALSSYKELAIQSIGFGTVNKIYFQFEEPFWDYPTVYLVFHHHLKGTEPLTKDSKMDEASSKYWTNSINRFSFTPGSPNVLCAWVAGEGAILMESLTDNEVIEDCMEILENILETKLPMPKKMLRSSWFLDPYAEGSYSYLSIDCENEGVLTSTLAVPEYAESYCVEHPVLMFAGEATSENYFSTVHGAFESGTREADKLFHHYRHEHIETVEKEARLSGMLLNKTSLSNNLHIVIVGAGVAGLTCALHLANNNFNNISIVEAQDRIGGRVFSVDYNGSFLELGAQWIHGTNNALYDFSNAHNLLPSIQEIVYEGKGIFCTSDGKVIESAIVEEVEKVVKDAKLKIDNGEYDKNTTKSVKSFLSEAFDTYVESCDKRNISLKRAILEWFMKFEVIDNACDDLDYVAIQSFTEWDDCPEELYHINFRKGFQAVLDTLFTQIPDIKLHLNTPVKTIKWNGDFKYQHTKVQNRLDDDFPVVLKCNDKNIFADSVIVTTSVGFLQEHFDTFFMPSLPPNKQKAFSKIGFGTVNKIFLIYEKPFWNPADRGFHFVWKSDGLGKCERLCIENPWVFGITGFDVMKQNPNVLLGWIGGNEARLMEGIKEECVSSVCTELLRTFLNNADIPDPIKIFRSCWYNNPYVRGSYSNRTPNFYEEETTLKDIQEPLCCSFTTKDENIQWPIVLFSGEATDESCFSSAHGAYSSGIKAAENLIKTCSDIERATEEAN